MRFQRWVESLNLTAENWWGSQLWIRSQPRAELWSSCECSERTAVVEGTLKQMTGLPATSRSLQALRCI
jgi:hypothetical protein